MNRRPASRHVWWARNAEGGAEGKDRLCLVLEVVGDYVRHLLTLDESIEVAVGVMTPYRFTNTWVGVTGPLDAGYGPGTEREFSLIVAVPSDGRNAHNDVLRRIGEAASPAIEGYLGAHGVRYHLDLGVGFGRQVLVTPIDTVTGGARFHVVFTVSVAQVRAPLMEHPAPRL